MRDILEVIRARHSARAPFDPDQPLAPGELRRILEAARWAPTPHNMQNFEVVVVDDRERLAALGRIAVPVSPAFVRESYAHLSFSEEELHQRRSGLLAAGFPPSWTSPAVERGEALDLGGPRPLAEILAGAPAVLVVLRDGRRRAPASEGDALGLVGLGCVLENMWLEAEAIGVSFQVVSALSAPAVEEEVRRLLGIPEHLSVALGCRLGHPVASPSLPRVRREVEAFTHRNAYGAKLPR